MSSDQCPFCNAAADRFVAANEHAVAIEDNYPVNPGHTLVVTKRHVATFFDASKEERLALWRLVDEVKQQIDEEHRPSGYNVGFNVGAVAGQTVMHVHVHVIPRYQGDVDDPTGGVRLVIPERGNYRRPSHIPRTPGTEGLRIGQAGEGDE